MTQLPKSIIYMILSYIDCNYIINKKCLKLFNKNIYLLNKLDIINNTFDIAQTNIFIIRDLIEFSIKNKKYNSSIKIIPYIPNPKYNDIEILKYLITHFHLIFVHFINHVNV